METNRLNRRLVGHWQAAAEDLGIRVTAPVELRDAAGHPFVCEALVHDFGSPIVVNPRTERQVRQNLRSLGDGIWFCIAQERRSSTYLRKYFIDELRDWGWFGPAGKEPSWYYR